MWKIFLQVFIYFVGFIYVSKVDVGGIFRVKFSFMDERFGFFWCFKFIVIGVDGVLVMVSKKGVVRLIS